MKKIFTLIASAALALCANANVWVTPDEAPAAGTTIIDDELCSANTVYETVVGQETDFPTNYEGLDLVNRMNLRVDAAPTAAVPEGTDKGSATPVIINAKKNLVVKFVYRRQAGDPVFGVNNGKDIKMYNQATNKNINPEEGVLLNDNGEYGIMVTTYKLAAETTYTLYARGTTAGLMAIFYTEGEAGTEPDIPVDPDPDPEPAVTITDVCPSNAIAYWYNATGAAEYTAPVGTFVASDGESVNYTNGDYKTIRVNGKKSDMSGTNVITVTPSAPLAAGDIIAVKCYRNKDTDAGASLYMSFGNGAEATIGAGNDGTEIKNVALGQQPGTLVYNVTAAEAGSTKIELARDKASTNIFVVAFQITNGDPVVGGIADVTVDKADTTVFNVLGQPVDSNYKGLVIKGGKKYIQR